MGVERPAAATRRAWQQAGEGPSGAHRQRQQARALDERQQRANLQRGRLRASVARDLEQLAVVHARRAGRLAGAAAEAAIERLARLLDREVAGDETLHDVDPPARAVRLCREQVVGGAVRQAETTRHALARELVEAPAPRVPELDGGQGRTAPSTAATSSGLAVGAGRSGASASRAAGVTSASRRPAS